MLNDDNSLGSLFFNSSRAFTLFFHFPNGWSDGEKNLNIKQNKTCRNILLVKRKTKRCVKSINVSSLTSCHKRWKKTF